MHEYVKFILFWNDTLHVSDGLSVRHQEFKTIHRATGVCQTDTAEQATCRVLDFKLSPCSICNMFSFG